VLRSLSATPQVGASIQFTTGDTNAYVIQAVSSATVNSIALTIITLAQQKVTVSGDGIVANIRYNFSNIRLTGHDFLSIGTGGIATTNYPGIPSQSADPAKQTLWTFPGRIYYVTTDQSGNFSVGQYFSVKQATGSATLNASAFNLSGLNELALGGVSLGGTGARPDDYAGTGYDKGHASPDGDQSWTQQVEYESFLMTNMYPQAGSLNRGIWKLLETSVRGWAVQLNQPFTIYVGAFYGAGDKTIGRGVIVPHGYYKIVINNATKEIAGWKFPHVTPYPNLGNDMRVFRTPVSQIESEAGVKYAFPAGARELEPGREWPVDFGALTNAKRAKCGASKDD
jgi:hypothetical protein